MKEQTGDWALIHQLETWGILLTPDQLAQLKRYLELLYETNQQFNLTRVPPEQAVGRHLIDSLCLLKIYPFAPNGRVLDVGTGAGLPGVLLAMVRPDLQITLLDSHAKSVRFLERVCLELGLSAIPIHARAEEWAHNPSVREQFDGVVARAVAKMPALAEIMLPFAKVGGVALALKSLNEREEILSAQGAIEKLGGELVLHEVTFQTEQGEITRLIAKIAKLRPTPNEYPRRWSQILKQPLR